jgi:hypothetical protein
MNDAITIDIIELFDSNINAGIIQDIINNMIPVWSLKGLIKW